jgi:hypothetical protein
LTKILANKDDVRIVFIGQNCFNLYKILLLECWLIYLHCFEFLNLESILKNISKQNHFYGKSEMTFETIVPNPIEENNQQSSPFSFKKLFTLYFRPREYFSHTNDLYHRGVLIVASILAGITGAMDRIDRKIIEAELGHAGKGWESTSEWLITSWSNYWLTVVGVGLISAVIVLYLGGWWYKKRLQWSGAENPSPALARNVYITQYLILSLPNIILVLIQTALFSNYREAWRADEIWSSFLLLFVFWSCWTSYTAATTVFQLSKFKAKLWFLVFPILIYIFVFGLIGTLYYNLVEN